MAKSSNYELYGEMSARVMTLLSRYSAWVEVCSIDEAFLGIRGTLDELQAWGEKIKGQVHNNQLFTFIDPPKNITGPIKSTTNCLEGGINAQIKALARNHRGMTDEHQRIAVDWWLYLHTQLPDDPVQIARQQKWGQDALAKVKVLIHQERPDAHREDGRPATYDTGIDATPTNSMGVRKGWLGR